MAGGRDLATRPAPISTDTPFSVTESFYRLNLRARSTWISVGALTAVADRDRFARPRLNDGAVALCAAHALWRHSRRHLVRAVQRAADDLGELMVHDRPAARRRAAAIATQLRAVLGRPDNALGAGINDAILGAVVDAAGDGLTVETTFRIEADVGPLLVEPVVAALRAALRNIIDHAATDRAVLRVVVDAKYVQVTLRDRGRGRDDLRASDLASVNDALTGVTALVEVSSSNERGTRIQITVPT